MSFLKRLPIFSFDFWQKFGKALMVVVAVMPVAGIMISLGKALDMASSFELAQTTARLIEDMGWAVIGILHILFDVDFGCSIAKERAGGVFSSFMFNLFLSLYTGYYF